jgi:hypothetical protein
MRLIILIATHMMGISELISIQTHIYDDIVVIDPFFKVELPNDGLNENVLLR